MRRSWLAVSVCGVVAILAASVWAQQASQRGLAERFKQLDRNGDGKISAAEFPGALFKQMDRNGDGFVTMEEARAFYARRGAQAPAAGRAARPTNPPAGAPLSARLHSAGALAVVDVVFELCVRDVASVTRFYRDGIGMRDVEPADAQKGALLEWAGCYVRLRNVSGDAPPAATGNPMRQMLASNGFRWFSLWSADPAAIGERLVKAGYAAPMKGGNVTMTRDPEGNVVELMGVPRGAAGETFTWGMAVGDETAARRFYGDVLGLAEFDPWDLPPPYSMKMYLFATGAGRIKFSAPPGERPREADRGPDSPGLRSVTLRVADLAATRDGLTKRGATVTGDQRLLVTDPDGNRLYIETAPPDAIKAAAARPPGAPAGDTRSAPAPSGGRPAAAAPAQRRPRDLLAQYGNVTPTPHKEEIVEERPGEPPLKRMPDSDATRDAAGRGQLFESISVKGLTDLQEGMNGLAIVDLNKDGRLDIVATFSAPRGTGGWWGVGEKLRVLINDGGFRFHTHAIALADSKVTPGSFGQGQVPGLADFNNDGFLDLFVTRHAQMTGGRSNPNDQKLGNSLFVSDGAWDRFRDVSSKMGITNEQAYNRQPSFGDVNRDGWIDVAVGCDNIKDAMGGVPHSRLFVFKPNGPAFAGGTFQDVGGTDLVPDFGGFFHDSAKDKAGPDINLRDLDNDGDLDLIQSYHVDVLDPAAAYSPAEYRQGVFCWKNMLVETGRLRFEKITGNGLAVEARLKWNPTSQAYDAQGKAPGLPYISLADVDNDGLLDVLAVGPAAPGWAPRAEYVSGRFWRNRDGFQFQEATDAAGLSALNWPYRDWVRFFEMPSPSARGAAGAGPLERRPYFADAVFGDFDNDGWLDLVVLDRHESPNLETRALLFMNRGDGTFEPKPTTMSGLDGMGIAGEAADLDNDGLLDLVFAADPDNSGVALSMARYESKVYWNTGLRGGRANHWLRLRFSGVTDAALIGARVEVLDPATEKLVAMRVIAANHSYKSGGALDAHVGLGTRQQVHVRVTLPGGTPVTFRGVSADQFLELNLKTRQSTPVSPKGQP